MEFIHNGCRKNYNFNPTNSHEFTLNIKKKKF